MILQCIDSIKEFEYGVLDVGGTAVVLLSNHKLLKSELFLLITAKWRKQLKSPAIRDRVFTHFYKMNKNSYFLLEI